MLFFYQQTTCLMHRAPEKSSLCHAQKFKWSKRNGAFSRDIDSATVTFELMKVVFENSKFLDRKTVSNWSSPKNSSSESD